MSTSLFVFLAFAGICRLSEGRSDVFCDNCWNMCKDDVVIIWKYWHYYCPGVSSYGARTYCARCSRFCACDGTGKYGYQRYLEAQRKQQAMRMSSRSMYGMMGGYMPDYYFTHPDIYYTGSYGYGKKR